MRRYSAGSLMETETIRGSWLLPTLDLPVIQDGLSTLPRTREMPSLISVIESSQSKQSCLPGPSAILFGIRSWNLLQAMAATLNRLTAKCRSSG